MRLIGGERRPRGVDEVLGAGGPILGRQREHPRKGLGHPAGERPVIIHGHADELCSELEHAGPAVGLTLRHEHERLTVTPSHSDWVVLSLGEHLSRVLTQVRGSACAGTDGCRGHAAIIFGTYSEVERGGLY